MPILNFTMFIDKVISGEKRQTIRKLRKRPFKVGDKLYLYSGLRTKKAKNIVTLANGFCVDVDDRKKSYAICQEVHSIEITHYPINDKAAVHPINIGGKFISDKEKYQLAVMDGFNNDIEFMNFFENTHGFPFKGQIIRW